MAKFFQIWSTVTGYHDDANKVGKIPGITKQCVLRTERLLLPNISVEGS